MCTSAEPVGEEEVDADAFEDAGLVFPLADFEWVALPDEALSREAQVRGYDGFADVAVDALECVGPVFLSEVRRFLGTPPAGQQSTEPTGANRLRLNGLPLPRRSKIRSCRFPE